jgi:hypothetical protein
LSEEWLSRSSFCSVSQTILPSKYWTSDLLKGL